VTAIPEVALFQRVVEPYGLRPTYVVDYPVAATPSSAGVFAGLVADRKCRIGAHLHPWVTPPFSEALTTEMSFGSNLGISIERAKIETLTEAIVNNIGVRPRVFKAGRYGFGPSTAAVLESLGYDVDTSVIPHMDFSSERGPNFTGFSVRPALFGEKRPLLELPCTLDFTGIARHAGASLHRLASSSWLSPFRAVGVLAQSGVLNKVMLSPEGNRLAEMTALTSTLFASGIRTFAMTFHSPSLKPGCTRYVRSAADRDAFLDTINRFCDFFFTRLGGEATTAEDLYANLVGARVGPARQSTQSPIHSLPS